ncbi:hypothetical protein [Vibrio coralliilyticus]|uniref:hypothetical protein n=1 Tax=Vibrio coralliilyticus TaxID=190893 RepID=UPI0015616D69|nr:hypothetical protein [Vibrio coralliilyticus]NRF63704.1 hypothetical protein [Vibrio coralliilyticus]
MEETKPTSATAKGIPSLLESVVDIRFLVLLLCLISYLDLWLVSAQVNPKGLSLSSAYSLLLTTPVFDLMLFLGSYSLLVIGLIPASRGLLSLARLQVFGTLSISNITKESKQLSDWAAGFVCFSSYGALSCLFLETGSYKGLLHFIVTFSSTNIFVGAVFKISFALFWLYCISLALRADFEEPDTW